MDSVSIPHAGRKRQSPSREAQRTVQKSTLVLFVSRSVSAQSPDWLEVYKTALFWRLPSTSQRPFALGLAASVTANEQLQLQLLLARHSRFAIRHLWFANCFLRRASTTERRPDHRDSDIAGQETPSTSTI